MSRKIEVDVEGIELISIYSLWNLCNVIDIQLLLSLFVAIYYEAIDVQEGVTSHVIAFLL